jgi:diphthamide synthase (EF-2-diphthine--ammonia ligase)
MKTLVSWSSGKDSAWMVHVLRQRGDVEIGALLTTVNASAQRVAMHGVRVDVLEGQAAAIGAPLWIVPIPYPCPNDVYERAMGEAVARAVREGFTHAAFGDLFLADIRQYREERLAGSGLTPLFPLFDSDPAWTARLAREMIAGGVRARITCVDPAALRAPSAASSTPARTTVRCSAGRSRSRPASPSSATGSCLPIWFSRRDRRRHRCRSGRSGRTSRPP